MERSVRRLSRFRLHLSLWLGHEDLLTDLEVAYRLTCGEAKLRPALPTVAHVDECTLQADRAPALMMGASQSKKA